MSKQCVSAWRGKQGNVIMERELNGFIQKGELKWKKKEKNELKGIKECMRFREK